MDSAAMATVGREEDLLEALDSKAAKVALQAINNGYKVNWGEFDFKNPEDDQRATKVQGYLDTVLGRKSINWYNKSANLRLAKPLAYSQDPDYQRCDTKYKMHYNQQLTLSDSWSNAMASAYGYPSSSLPSTSQLPLRPEFEMAPEDKMAPSISMSTSSEILLEQLDEKETKAVLWAITHKFAVTNPADDIASGLKINQYLLAVLERKQQAHPGKKYSTQWRNLGRYDS